MSAILNSLNAHYFLIFQPILMILVSKFMVYRALSDKTYLLLGLLSSLKKVKYRVHVVHEAMHNNYLYNHTAYYHVLQQVIAFLVISWLGKENE